jgi:hypothetical protein
MLVCGILLSVAFLALLVPSYANRFNARIASEKIVDPLTGAPLRMVWLFRWLTVVIAFFLFVGAGDEFSPPSASLRLPQSPARRQWRL